MSRAQTRAEASSLALLRTLLSEKRRQARTTGSSQNICAKAVLRSRAVRARVDASSFIGETILTGRQVADWPEVRQRDNLRGFGLALVPSSITNLQCQCQTEAFDCLATLSCSSIPSTPVGFRYSIALQLIFVKGLPRAYEIKAVLPLPFKKRSCR